MISLNIQNCLIPKISDGNGINSKTLLEELQKNEAVLDSMKKNTFGFQKLPHQKKNLLELIKKEVSFIQKRFKTVFIIGIGGSSLGAIALAKSFQFSKTQKQEIHFFDNPESGQIKNALSQMKSQETLLIPISKSGNTIESLSILAVFYQKIKKDVGKNAAKHVLAITEENNGTLATIAKEEGWKTLSIPKDVGGRFSVFSNVGLLPAALFGLKIESLLKGAKQTELETAYLLAILQFLFYKKKKDITVIFGYSKIFDGIIDWYMQLLAESIGKNIKTGPTPLKALGPLDQHSLLQLFMEGPNNKFFLFLETAENSQIKIPPLFKKYDPYSYLQGKTIQQLTGVEKKSTAEALTTKNRPNITLKLPKMDEENLGEVLYLFELQVAILGELFKINAFDQPGVELGKKLAKKYLSEIS